jgi:hypothetical protein
MSRAKPLRSCLPSHILFCLALCSSFAGQTARPNGQASQAEFKQLYARPLKLPTLKKGSACPLSESSRETVPRVQYIFCSGCPFYGSGLAYFAPAWFDETSGHVTLSKSMPREQGRYRIKTAWVSKPDYSGPILARGRRLEDGEEVKFSFLGQGYRDLQLSAPSRRDPSEWSFWPSSMFLSRPGCYGMQIDTAQGSDVVIFAVDKKLE